MQISADNTTSYGKENRLNVKEGGESWFKKILGENYDGLFSVSEKTIITS